MKHLRIALVAMACLAIAGCNLTAPGTTAQSIANKITDATATVKEKAAAAQGYATQICAYLPTITSVVAIFNSGFASDARTVGNAVCNAVTTLPLADGPGDRKPRVNGVLVKGKFVR